MTIPTPLTHANLASYKLLEFILLAGAADTGKTHDILSLADAWAKLEPKGHIYCLDVESKLAKEYRIKFPYLNNISIWYGDQVNTMEKFLNIFEQLWPSLRDIDWLAIESDTRIWALAQDEGWQKVTGMDKESWMSHRVEQDKASKKVDPVTPAPADLWSVTYDAYRRRYRDVLINLVSMKTNIIHTTGISTKQRQSSARKQSAAMIDMIDMSLDGHAEVSRNPDTVILTTKEMEIKEGRPHSFYRCTVKKDRGYSTPGEVVQFDPTENFWFAFLDACRQESGQALS